MRQYYSNDVLFGKATESYNHLGNFTFKGLIEVNKGGYISKSKKGKIASCKYIMNAIYSQSPPGRFLEYDSFSLTWIEMSKERVIKKIHKAFQRSGKINFHGQVSIPTNQIKIVQRSNVMANQNFIDNDLKKIQNQSLKELSLAVSKNISFSSQSINETVWACMRFEKSLVESCNELGLKQEDLDSMICDLFTSEGKIES